MFRSRPVGCKSSGSNANIRVRLDKSALTFPRLASSPLVVPGVWCRGRPRDRPSYLAAVPGTRSTKGSITSTSFLWPSPHHSPPLWCSAGRKIKRVKLSARALQPAWEKKLRIKKRMNHIWVAKVARKSKKWSIKLGGGGFFLPFTRRGYYIC